MSNKVQWLNRAKKSLMGKKIIDVRYMTDEEMHGSGWNNKPLVLIFDDGSLIYPSADDEGNDAGALFGQDKDGGDMSFPVL